MKDTPTALETFHDFEMYGKPYSASTVLRRLAEKVVTLSDVIDAKQWMNRLADELDAVPDPKPRKKSS